MHVVYTMLIQIHSILFDLHLLPMLMLGIHCCSFFLMETLSLVATLISYIGFVHLLFMNPLLFTGLFPPPNLKAIAVNVDPPNFHGC